jgi:hypothetical protein
MLNLGEARKISFVLSGHGALWNIANLNAKPEQISDL